MKVTARSQVNKNSNLLKTLSDPTRYQILEIIAQSDGNICVNDIADQLNISASAVSHQLRNLELQGVVVPNRIGKNTCYTFSDNEIVKKIKNIMVILN